MKPPFQATVIPKMMMTIKPDEKGYRARKEKLLEEDWKQLDMYPAESLHETYDETESRRRVAEICTSMGYLDKLSQMKIEHVGKLNYFGLRSRFQYDIREILM